MSKDGSVTVSAEITNTGEYEATEVVQCYMQDPYARIVQPVRKLLDFKKVTLQPGEQQTVSFTLLASQFAYLDQKLNKVLESGTIKLWVAPHARAGEAVEIDVV